MCVSRSIITKKCYFKMLAHWWAFISQEHPLHFALHNNLMLLHFNDSARRALVNNFMKLRKFEMEKKFIRFISFFNFHSFHSLLKIIIIIMEWVCLQLFSAILHFSQQFSNQTNRHLTFPCLVVVMLFGFEIVDHYNTSSTSCHFRNTN